MFADLAEMFPIFMFAGIALLVIGGIALSIYFEKLRREGMRQAADELGLPFYEQGDTSLINELSQFDLFSQGRSKKIKNMIHGETAAVDVGIFDYQYTTGSGKNSSTTRQSVICFQSPDLMLPRFSMRPEGFFDKIGGMLGFQDIDFDTHPDFSKSYVLKGDSEEGVRQLFNGEVLAFFESAKGVNVEGGGTRLIYFRPNNKIKPDQVREFMAEGFRVFKVFQSGEDA